MSRNVSETLDTANCLFYLKQFMRTENVCKQASARIWWSKTAATLPPKTGKKLTILAFMFTIAQQQRARCGLARKQK